MSSNTNIVIIILLLNITLSLSSTSPVSKSTKPQLQSKTAIFDEDQQQKHNALNKKTILSPPNNQTKTLKLKNSNSTAKGVALKAVTGKNTTTVKKIANIINNSTKIKLNKTLNSSLKSFNSTKIDKQLKPIKPTNTTKPLKSTNSTKIPLQSKTSKPLQTTKPIKATPLQHHSNQDQPKPQHEQTAWPDYNDAGITATAVDLISDFRDFPGRLLPDLERLSTTSKAYIYAANRGIAEGVRPLVGTGAASKVAPFLSSLLVAAPLILLAAAFRRLRLPPHLAVHRLLVFSQAYLAVYFATLALIAVATGLEPLTFLSNSSPASYTWTQAVQTLAYLVYLVAQMLDLIAVFSVSGDESPAPARSLALFQMLIGLGVGVHYYAAVFHRAVTGEAPRANWHVHAVYATCFATICFCAWAHKRKKLYEGEEDGKKS